MRFDLVDMGRFQKRRSISTCQILDERLAPMQDADGLAYQRMARGVGERNYEQLINDGVIIAASPETCASKIEEIRGAGFDRLILWTTFGGVPLDQSRRTMELFAREVQPGFVAA